MEKERCCISEIKSSKPFERMLIPSSVVSRIGSPLKNFIDIPNTKHFELSFVDTESELKTVKFDFDFQNSAEPVNNEDLLEELECLREKLKMINMKLEINQKKISEAYTDRSDKRDIETPDQNGIYKEDVLCSCTRSCTVF